VSAYDQIARLYDPWSVSVTEDVGFYVELAKEAGSVVELGVGTGRIAVPTAAAGVPVIGVDSSRGMLEVCAEAVAAAGVDLQLERVDRVVLDPEGASESDVVDAVAIHVADRDVVRCPPLAEGALCPGEGPIAGSELDAQR